MLGVALIVLGKAVVALVLAILAGRFVVRPLFQSLAATNNRETFTVVALFIVLAASAATARADLSLTLGAFLAGMAVSDTPYRHVVQNEVKPFSGLLLGLFFMSVGMGVNLPAMAAIWPAVLLTALVIVIVKTVVVFAAARLNGWAIPGATQLGFLLSQGSEFTLVVVGIASISGDAGQLGGRNHGGGGVTWWRRRSGRRWACTLQSCWRKDRRRSPPMPLTRRRKSRFWCSASRRKQGWRRMRCATITFPMSQWRPIPSASCRRRPMATPSCSATRRTGS
jgi:Kef-type K+ transport system membrane component KefB